jgi:hypothetical protein
MPDRVVPVLRKVHEENRGTSAGITAMTALFDWKLREKARGK